MSAVEDAHQGIVDAINASEAEVLADIDAERDQALPGDGEVRAFLNVVLSPERPEVMGEQLGLGEDQTIVEFVQTFDVEVILHEQDDDLRRSDFTAIQLAVAEALFADRTLGGKASGLTLGAPDYVNHTFAGAPFTAACVIPVRVQLRGLASMVS